MRGQVGQKDSHVTTSRHPLGGGSLYRYPEADPRSLGFSDQHECPFPATDLQSVSYSQPSNGARCYKA